MKGLGSMQASLPTMSLRDVAFILFKWKWEMLFVALLALLSGVVYLFIIRDSVYETSAKLMVKMGQEQAPPATMLEDRPMLVGQRPQDVRTEIDILLSTDLFQQLIDKLHLDVPSEPVVPEALIPRIKFHAKQAVQRVKDHVNEALIAAGARVRLTPREETLALLEKTLRAEAQPESNVIIASFLAPQREGSSDILNALVDLYLESRSLVYRDMHSLQYFENQVAGAETKLGGAESRLAAFEAERDIQQITEQETLLLTSLDDIQRDMHQAEIALREAELQASRLPGIEAASGSGFAALGSFEVDSFPEDLMTNLAELSRERELLSLEGTQSAQRIRIIDRERALLIEMLKNHIQAVHEERKETHSRYAAQYSALKNQLTTLHAQQDEWSQLHRDVEAAESAYMFYRAKLEDASAVAAMQEAKIGNVAVIQRASAPLYPSGVSKTKLLAIVAVFSVAVSLSWAAVREFFDHSVYTPDQLRRHVDVPVLSVVTYGHG